MQITNPVNAPLETLAVAAEYRPDVALTYVKDTGKLTLSSASILGCVLSSRHAITPPAVLLVGLTVCDTQRSLAQC